ncbi:MAG TPA: hypothetical protein VHB69_15000 [Mycobacteriales bacterium]|nr:hypothetical protein [Mycobacteriales bacterium]
MRSHELDPWSLVFGVAFLSVSGGYLLTHTTDVHLHWLLIVPATLIVIGVAIFGAVASRMNATATPPDGPSEVDVDDDRRVI